MNNDGRIVGDYFDPAAVRSWSADDVRAASDAIANGDPCPGCGGAWRPDTYPRQRRLRHADTCPYTAGQLVHDG